MTPSKGVVSHARLGLMVAREGRCREETVRRMEMSRYPALFNMLDESIAEDVKVSTECTHSTLNLLVHLDCDATSFQLDPVCQSI